MILYIFEKPILQELNRLNKPGITLSNELLRLSEFVAELNPDGTWTHTKATLRHRQINLPDNFSYVELATAIAKLTRADLNNPSCKGGICTCPTECDCQNYDKGFVSNECPEHNEEPNPSPDCPRHSNQLLA